MLEARQKNLRAFVISQGTEEEIIKYIEQNYILLRSFLLVFSVGLLNETIKKILCKRELNFIEENPKSPLKISNSKPMADVAVKETKEEAQEQMQTKAQENHKTKIISRTIRSGEEIISLGDLSVFGQVNSGAFLQSEGNLQIFGVSMGDILCNGDYLILSAFEGGNVIFGGEIIDREKLLDKKAKKIYKKDEKIMIEEL
ncbi:septum site-determining protein MinC [Helicobacter burdigaliensis]|uniref:septum site-determining protein MinC n=1 Tax=Helicobacter burdigaliensis TaxID=2315334 RepID=UPI000EF6D8D7|nr:septum site-determining protein MinC [Helicobacter burdigaliensis]